MVRLLLLSIISMNLIAQDYDYADVGASSQKSVPGVESSNRKIKKVNSVDKAAPKQCSSKDQISLPQRDLKSLMIHPGKIEVKSLGGGDYLTVGLSQKIRGNCVSMLKPELKWSTQYNKYTYEVKVRNPCEENACEYEVSWMEGTNKIVETKKYAPTLEGFYKCMEENIGTVEKDGERKWNEAKAVRAELEKKPTRAHVTSNVLFLSKGPKAEQKSRDENQIPNNDCDFYEKINGGSQHFSKADLNYGSLKRQAQALCKSSRYSDVESGLSTFEGYDELHSQLTEVRNQLLLNELTKERKWLQSLKGDKDLSEIDISRYNKLLKDYYSLIVDKNLSTKNHTEQDSQNPDLLVNLKARYDEAIASGSYELAKEYKKKIEKKTNELAAFLKAPYFNVSDYRAMVDISNKPQMDKSEWKNATKTLHKSLMSLKLLCEAYGTSETCKNQKPGNKNFKTKKTLVSLDAVNKRAAEWNKKAMDDYDDKLSLIKKPNGYKSLKYQKLLNECEGHKAVAKQYSSSLQVESQKITQACQAQSRGNQAQYQSCMQSYKGQIEGDAKFLTMKHENCKDMKAHYTQQKTKWEKLEADRDVYLGLTTKQRKSKKAKVEKVMAKDKFDYSFEYKGIQQPTYQANSNYNLNFNSNANSYNNRQPSMSTNPYSNSYFSNNNYSSNSYMNNYNTNNSYNSNPYSSNNYNSSPYMSNNYYSSSSSMNPYMMYGNNNNSSNMGMNYGLNYGMNMGMNQGYNQNTYQYGNNNMGNYNMNGNYAPTTNTAGGFRFNMN